MIKHRIFLGLILLQASCLGLLLLFGQSRVSARTEGELRPMKTLVKTLQLTDLAIWTEARYTRHPSQADWFTPFQDFPSALEHFPAGSIMAPPQQGNR
jgi:hypothetical protein